MSDISAEIITFHGWGFSPEIWSDWEQVLTNEYGHKIMHADRGYFGEQNIPEFQENSNPGIIIVHSYGLHWCPKELLNKADHLIIVSGFLSFHPDGNSEARKSKLILRQMMSRFVEKPKEVMSDFYSNVYYPSETSINVPGKFRHDQLLEDLEKLGSSNINPDILHNLPAITIFHGEKDRVISNHKARDLFGIVKRRAQYFEIKHAGHGVAFTHTGKCLQFLKPLFKPAEVGHK